MKIGLFPMDGKFPNVAIMQISTYHKSLGDTVKLNSPGEINYISCIFTKNRHKVERLIETLPNAIAGGTGWDKKIKLPPEIEQCKPDYSLYPSCDYGLGFTSRGCDGDCKFCVVPEKEGPIKSVASIYDIHREGTDLLVLLDNDFLGNPDYIDRLNEIRELDIKVSFTQGLNIRKINEFNAHMLSKIKHSNYTRKSNRLHFAFDKLEYEPFVRGGVKHLNRAGIKPYRILFYMLCGFDTSFEEDMARFKIITELGCYPFVMLYEGANKRLRHFARWVNTKTFKVCKWEEYEPWAKISGQMNLFAG